MKTLRHILYIFIQCTWGFLQTLAGFFVYLYFRRSPHFSYHSSIGTLWTNPTSASLGLFLFVSQNCSEETRQKLCIHEYGHAIQSLILGPLYLPLMALPSMLWCFLPVCGRYRRDNSYSYYRFYTERNANWLGRLVTREKPME